MCKMEVVPPPSRPVLSPRGLLSRLVFAIAGCWLVSATTSFCLPGQSGAEAPGAQSSAYEVASVKPSAPDPSDAGQTAINGDRFVGKNLSVQQMVYAAYDIHTDDLIVDLPPWTHSARLDIQAKLVDSHLHGTEMDRSRVFLKALLADRFQLNSHDEMRERRVYALVADKHGPRMQQASAADHREMSLRRGDIHLRAAPMELLVQGISLTVGRPVIDRTALTGRYNIDLKCATDELSDLNEGVAPIFTALREQLGLRLLPTKSPVKVLVIDRVERPSADK